MLKKKIPYQLKVLGLTAIAPFMLNSCKKDTPEDPNAKQIQELTETVKATTAQYRIVIEDAKTKPYSITNSFNISFHAIAADMGIDLANAVDSAKVTQTSRFIDQYKSAGEYGNPENMGKLKTTSEKLVLTNEQLEELLAKQR